MNKMFRETHKFFSSEIHPLNVKYYKGISLEEYKLFFSRDEWSREQVLSFQARELRSIMTYASQHSPYYRKVFSDCAVDVNAEDIFGEIGKIPPLTKQDVRTNLDSIMSDEFRGARRLIKKATGGSTGEPLVLWGDKEDYRWNCMVIDRQRHWIGWRGGMEAISIFGGFLDLPSITRKFAKRIFANTVMINNMDSQQADYERIYERISKEPPELLEAYFSSLCELARVAEEQEIPLNKKMLIIACAEPINERARIHAEKWLGNKVYFQYGCRELGALGQECYEQNGYHYPQDSMYLEVLDNQSKPAASGHLTVTYFCNRVVPLIRYQLGDAAELDDSPCSCGLPYTRLKSVEGRISSMVVTPEGRKITSIIFPHIFKDYPWIVEYQVEQAAVDIVKIRIRRDINYYTSESEGILLRAIQRLIGNSIRIEMIYGQPFLEVPTGKHVYFISTM